jgi:hypothetical protein
MVTLRAWKEYGRSLVRLLVRRTSKRERIEGQEGKRQEERGEVYMLWSPGIYALTALFPLPEKAGIGWLTMVTLDGR